ncbi:hypothetical protein J3Q64DRAFT_1610650, partial [Phycomyces blakesleeanus]
IECTSTIYSFGAIVLESKEIQQALWLNEGKYMYSFVCVNQFFDAFMKGIRALPAWNEIDVAINNLCLVQVFEDVEAKYGNTIPQPTIKDIPAAPLLTMVYEFERGQGSIEMAIVSD